MKSSLDVITPDIAPTIFELFNERTRRTPDSVAYRYCNKMTGTWHDTSWREIGNRVALWRTALMNEKLECGDRVAVMLPNCLEWVCLDLAAHSLGLVVVPLYVNDRAENVAYIIEDTEAKVFLCPGMACWEHLTPVFDRLKNVQRIVTIDFCNVKKDDERITCISDWLPHVADDNSAFTPSEEDTATIVYTSGTTGPPKGVMLSHRNMIQNAYAGTQCIDIYPDDLFLSFLPLSHMLERTVGFYLPMMTGATVAFARSIPELADDLLAVKPTVLIAVPRIFERVYNKIVSQLDAKPPILQKLFHMAVETGWHHFQCSQKQSSWAPTLLLKPLLDLLVAKKVQAKLGGKLRVIISGGAPLSNDIAKFFIGLGLPIFQGYGLTETSPIIAVNRVDNNRPDGVGLPLPGVEVQIGEFSEILVRGPSVMQGYWKRPEATAENIDLDGWLHTGDRGEIVDGHLRIIGRIKEIIVLSNGEKVSPSDVELAVALDPLFEQSMVIGEGRSHLTLLAVLDRDRWQMLAEELGISAEDTSLKLESVHEAVLARVEKTMNNFPGYAYIKKAVLTLEPWTVEDGMLTPTMKIRRKNIIRHMQQKIDLVYNR